LPASSILHSTIIPQSDKIRGMKPQSDPWNSRHCSPLDFLHQRQRSHLDPETPMLAVLEQFENAPATGPNEAPMPVRPVPDANELSWTRITGKVSRNIPFSITAKATTFCMS